MAYAPEPDLFIRTGGEKRISNFLLWQLAYTELYFTDLLWPDFDAAALDAAIESYRQPRAPLRPHERAGADPTRDPGAGAGRVSVAASAPSTAVSSVLATRVVTAAVLVAAGARGAVPAAAARVGRRACSPSSLAARARVGAS